MDSGAKETGWRTFYRSKSFRHTQRGQFCPPQNQKSPSGQVGTDPKASGNTSKSGSTIDMDCEDPETGWTAVSRKKDRKSNIKEPKSEKGLSHQIQGNPQIPTTAVFTNTATHRYQSPKGVDPRGVCNGVRRLFSSAILPKILLCNPLPCGLQFLPSWELERPQEPTRVERRSRGWRGKPLHPPHLQEAAHVGHTPPGGGGFV